MAKQNMQDSKTVIIQITGQENYYNKNEKALRMEQTNEIKFGTVKLFDRESMIVQQVANFSMNVTHS